jgi:hypothetical protein
VRAIYSFQKRLREKGLVIRGKCNRGYTYILINRNHSLRIAFVFHDHYHWMEQALLPLPTGRGQG